VFHSDINAYSLAFFDKYLKGDEPALLSGAPAGDVADYRAAAH